MKLFFAAPLHEITRIFRSQFGFHFAVVHARKPEGIAPFDEVRSAIENALWLGQQDRKLGGPWALASQRSH